MAGIYSGTIVCSSSEACKRSFGSEQCSESSGISFYLSSLVQEENLLLPLLRSHDFVGIFIASK